MSTYEDCLFRLKKKIGKLPEECVLSYWDVYCMIDDIIEPDVGSETYDMLSRTLTNEVRTHFTLYDQTNPNDFLKKVRNKNLISYSEHLNIRKVQRAGKKRVEFHGSFFPVDNETGLYIVVVNKAGELLYNSKTHQVSHLGTNLGYSCGTL